MRTIASIFSLVILTAVTALPCRADDDCFSAQFLVNNLKRQIRDINEQMSAVDRSITDLDRAETDNDALYGNNTSQNAVARKALDIKIAGLVKECAGQGGKGPACNQIALVRREQSELDKNLSKTEKQNHAQRAGLTSAQNGRQKQSFELELNLRDAQSDLETATRDLEECKAQRSAGTPSARSQRSRGSSGNGWSSF